LGREEYLVRGHSAPYRRHEDGKVEQRQHASRISCGEPNQLPSRIFVNRNLAAKSARIVECTLEQRSEIFLGEWREAEGAHA